MAHTRRASAELSIFSRRWLSRAGGRVVAKQRIETKPVSKPSAGLTPSRDGEPLSSSPRHNSACGVMRYSFPIEFSLSLLYSQSISIQCRFERSLVYQNHETLRSLRFLRVTRRMKWQDYIVKQTASLKSTGGLFLLTYSVRFANSPGTRLGLV